MLDNAQIQVSKWKKEDPRSLSRENQEGQGTKECSEASDFQFQSLPLRYFAKVS